MKVRAQVPTVKNATN
nr:nigerythrin - Desulfovibrio vulgaris [Nitratidesulfovibrio vulgaris]AAB25542.1 nigerythrin {N-terminal} [Desulfovibrio vulgaris, Peptide Partial, 15 aa] [Nitratidesulfovibrio vulgaris]